jgi:hypothetical protein
MYATIPHYRLRAFHEFLMTRPEYQEHCRIVDNYLVPSLKPPRNPTVIEVLGPEYTSVNEEIHIDDTVLEDWDVEEKDAILKAGRKNTAGDDSTHGDGPDFNGIETESHTRPAEVPSAVSSQNETDAKTT